MHAPNASAPLGLPAFSVLWRSAVDQLAEGLMRRLAAGNAVVLARMPPDPTP
jgi:hypothetical protein